MRWYTWFRIFFLSLKLVNQQVCYFFHFFLLLTVVRVSRFSNFNRCRNKLREYISNSFKHLILITFFKYLCIWCFLPSLFKGSSDIKIAYRSVSCCFSLSFSLNSHTRIQIQQRCQRVLEENFFHICYISFKFFNSFF